MIPSFSTLEITSYLLLINLLTFACYGLDKRAAKLGHSRIPERALHLMTLCGGTFGAWFGQRYFRHKTYKRSFQTVFWGIIVIQALFLWRLSGRW
jgi:uncharacterized membrane protein YsdA (DUF1294 family)